jgi:excisionase family DNA binding protein
MTRDERAEFEARPTNTVESTAAYLGIGRGQAYEAVRRGEIPSLRLNRRVLVPTAKLLAMLEAA